MNIASQSSLRTILLCPGPVMLSKAVQAAVVGTNIGHREKEFSDILRQSAAMLLPVAGANNSYEVAFVTGSGTAANETIIAGFAALGPILVVSNGEFGERLLEIARTHSDTVDHLRFNWQEKIDLAQLEQALQARPYKLVLVVHHETSTGMLNPVAAIAASAHQYGALVSVDAVSSIGAETLRASEWDIDILVGVSGKALSGMPGIGILIVKAAVLNLLTPSFMGNHYLDLYKIFYFMRTFGQTPNTPAVHVFVALHAALCELTKKGLVAFQRGIGARARLTRYELTRLGLGYASYEGATSQVITCVTLPAFLHFSTLAARLKDKGIVIYNGKGPLKDKLFQIGHIGALKKEDTLFALHQLDKLMTELRAPKPAIQDLDNNYHETMHGLA